MKLSPARVAAFLAGLSGLAGAIAVPVANLDTHDTSAVIGGMAVIAAAVVKWLDGQQKHEARQAKATPVQGVLQSTPGVVYGTAGTTVSLSSEQAASITADEDDDLPADELPPEAEDIKPADPSKVPPDEGDPGQPTPKEAR